MISDNYNWKNFITRLKTMSLKSALEVTPSIAPQVFTSTRKFANVSDENLFDVFDIFNADQIQYIREFDMQNIGRYRINTVPSITRKDTSTYQRILASILKVRS